MMDEAFDLALLQQWVGRTEVKQDVIQPAMAEALAATLDRAAPQDALPPLWHWIYFWTAVPASEVGEDGHPRRGGFLPPVPLPRRMWAGGRLTFTAPLALGRPATRTSRILEVNAKNGATGTLAFVTVRHEIAQDGRIAVTEEHDIVYRALPQPGAAAPAAKMAPADAAWSREITPDPVLLFRYSALTFNGHRIHYDRSYVTGVEGYPGLIVHGPLIATLLLDLLQRNMPEATVTQFNFRAVGPIFDIEPFTVCGQPAEDGRSVKLWAKNQRGELAMQAEALVA
nr:MaoC family dehydratase N-terminal domain-containing protein [uncultured Noviherbaspirillum sp.]